MYDLKIIRNYAVALFENTTSKKEQDSVLQQLQNINNLVQVGSKAYKIMCSPIISNKIKEKGIDLLAKKLKLDKKLVKFLKIIINNARFVLFSNILEHYVMLYDKSHGQKHAQLISASKLSKKEITMIKHFLEKEVKANILLNNQIDETLLGGVVIKYDSNLIDCSVKGALERIEKVAIRAN